MIVVDTNIIAHLYFPTLDAPVVEELQREQSDWRVPILWRSEFINVATGYFRKGLISYEGALNAIYDAIELLNDFEIDAEIEAVMAVIKKSKCSSNDCQFIALADKLETRLITYDKQLLKEFPDIAIKPEDYLALNQA